jgi:hypothetical protein
MIRPALLAVLGGVWLSSTSGCETLRAYPGPERPRAETARIIGRGGWPDRTYVNLLDVDGHEFDPDWSDNTALVLRGRHTVYVEAQWDTALFSSGGGEMDDHRRAALTFDVEAGCSYLIRTDAQLNLWVEEKGSSVIPSRESRTGPRCRNHHRLGMPARGYHCPVYEAEDTR